MMAVRPANCGSERKGLPSRALSGAAFSYVARGGQSFSRKQPYVIPHPVFSRSFLAELSHENRNPRSHPRRTKLPYSYR